MHVLHAIHDFPPRHEAGSEIYALELARAQSARHFVTVLCAEYDPARAHGHVAWRVHQGVPVVEIVNNWRCATFEETYRPPLVVDRIRHVLRILRPDVVHVHNLLNLSFDLPAVARELGIPVVATLHDYTLVCASGGQRIHRRDNHVCHEIDPARCARCFTESPFHAQAAAARVPAARAIGRAAAVARRLFPVWTTRAAGLVRRTHGMAVTAPDIRARLAAARRIFHEVDLFVAPSSHLAAEFRRLGVPAERLRVCDYGMSPLASVRRRTPRSPLCFGFVGTIVWHKGIHVLIEAMRSLGAASYRARIFGSLETAPEYGAELRRSATGLPVEFMGGFSPQDASEVYEQIDVLVVPSLWPENSPLVIHEAYQMGVPIVASHVGGIAELVTDGVSGVLFEPGSPADLARALRAFVDDPARVSKLAVGAPAVKSMADHVSEWDAAYAQVTRGPARQSA